ncbi:MAG TPA: hypothetical protein PK530_00265 [Anaerolineales bacterium]|nr:hypothetical protein [Anaerolineales bacterium]
MFNSRTQALENHAKLLEAVNLTAEEMQAYSDRIQKRAHAVPELTGLCEFSATIQLRRLLSVPARTWGATEIRWSTQLLDKLTGLKKRDGHAATLALACLGYARPDLPLALDAIQAPVPPLPPPAFEPDSQPLTYVPELEPVALVSDEELDPQTQADLAALRAQAALRAGEKKSTPRKR